MHDGTTGGDSATVKCGVDRLIPICSHCKKIRTLANEWITLEISSDEHFDLRLTHGICPECLKKFYPEFCKEK